MREEPWISDAVTDSRQMRLRFGEEDGCVRGVADFIFLSRLLPSSVGIRSHNFRGSDVSAESREGKRAL